MLGALCLIVLAGNPATGADNYALVPAKSRLTFDAEQQGAEFTGRFERFDATLRIDPANPANNRLAARIEMASVNTQYPERDAYLVGDEWFDVARYREASFVAEGFEPAADGSFSTQAQLTMRGETQPLEASFRFDGERLTGEAVIDRLAFGVGQGQWADDRMVGVKVAVQVDVAMQPAE